jgi:SAM-dependent methyltransferase
MERDSWDELFDEIYLSTYGPRTDHAASESEALAAARLAGCEPGSDILDAPCGFGRHSIPLARAGYRTVGADRSPALLDAAKKAAGEAEWPRWVHADHRELPLDDESFDAVLCLFSSLGFRGEDGDAQTLAEFHRVLRPGGRLVVETMHRDRLVKIFQPRGWEPLTGESILVEERRFDQVGGTVETQHTLFGPDGARRSFGWQVRVYTVTELARLVETAGFGDLEHFGSLEGEELTTETRLVVLARKPPA